MVKTTGGPGLATDVSSPALTSGALALLQQNLTQEESELWGSLGPNWTQSQSVLLVCTHFKSTLFWIAVCCVYVLAHDILNKQANSKISCKLQ